MQTFILPVIMAAMPLPGLCGDAPAKESEVVRPVLWWSDLSRVSDGGGPALKSHTELLTDAKSFAKFWTKCEMKGAAPQINFKDYFVVVAFRESGVDFQLNGGLAVGGKGDAKVVGLPAHRIVTNAGWYSTTIGVFPRKAIVSVEGHKLPAVE
jgi:hypothetical protein